MLQLVNFKKNLVFKIIMTNKTIKTSLTFVLAAVVVSMVGGNPMAYADFSGDYDPTNWALTTNGGTGSVDTTGAPASIELTGSNTDTDDFVTVDTDFTATIVCDGIVDFDWDYVTDDADTFDPSYYLVNGAQTLISETDNTSGSESVPVSAGNPFGFRVNTEDDQFGEARLTISNFDVSGCIDLTGSFDAVVHSGADIDKEVSVEAAFDQGNGLVDAFDMAVIHTSDCTDALGNPVITVTPVSGLLEDFGDTASFNEKVTAMPGSYHCEVVFTVTDDDGDFGTVTQTNWIDVIGSVGYWKNHPDATAEACDDGADATDVVIGLTTFTDAECDDLQDVLETKGGNTADKFARQAAAAQLNEIATATTPCTSVDDALDDGNALIAALGWTAPGDVSNGDSKDDKAAINDAKDILDGYNNDSFCTL